MTLKPLEDRILAALKHQPMTVDELEQKLQVPAAQIRRSLGLILAKGLEKDGVMLIKGTGINDKENRYRVAAK